MKPWRQTLLHRDVVLMNCLTLEETGIRHGDTLTLVVKVHAGPLRYASPSSSSNEDELVGFTINLSTVTVALSNQ